MSTDTHLNSTGSNGAHPTGPCSHRSGEPQSSPPASSPSNLIADLQWRDLIADCTDLPALAQRLARGPVTLYCGFDPTADSLHVGHLMGLLTLRRFQLAGHRPIALAGGATGMIGDPSGKSEARNFLTVEEMAHNVGCIKKQLRMLLDFDVTDNPARVVDNGQWAARISHIDFLREVGLHFSVNLMLAKESVRNRLKSEAGLSYTEFSYMLLQAHDFFHLWQHFQCELQIGGSDQWGNITLGADLVRKKTGQSAHGLTFPLITKSDGTKYGKTESGAVWLDPTKTSPFEFYQFFINTPDDLVVPHLRRFTFLTREQIQAVETEHLCNPALRIAQAVLAREVTSLIHGQSACLKAQRASEALFQGDLPNISEEVLEELSREVPVFRVPRARFADPGMAILDLAVQSGLFLSKGTAREELIAGGIYLNNHRATHPHQRIPEAVLLHGRFLLLRRGKKKHLLVAVK